MSFLALKNISKSYGSGHNKSDVLSNINLDIKEGEFVAIVGFSGTGKTTLISTIAGLIKPDSGEVTMEGKKVTGPSSERGVVFQSYSLMPWLTVFGNVALAVDSVFSDLSASERTERIEKYINMVGLSHATHRHPSELSGGMRQRVNVARALAASPHVLLLDEPLSALDALTRANLQDEIIRIWEQEKKTVVLITNDVDEGLIMADRIIPLNPGPNATFGPEFIVDLPRPRDRTAMNHDENFKKLRSDITQYLMSVGIGDSADSTSNVYQLPNVQPNTASDFGLSDDEKPDALKPYSNNMGDKKYLEYFNLTKVYPTPKGPLTVVDKFELNIGKGEFISIIGHSGCGKSTVLSMTAGLTDISDGGIVLDKKEVSAAGPDRAVVFQAPSLFPWLSAKENVALGVERVYPHCTPAERNSIVEYYLSKVGLSEAFNKKAAELSNGMKQRVGISRAFALSPKLLLLDEPFGMLDSLTRWELQEVLMEVWTRTKVTAIMVTHDVDEAILLADRVVMMTNGPNAKVGKVMKVDLPRPRTRKALVSHPDYYKYREELLTFLAECDNH
ncbi:MULTISPECIES: ABC transporter ATP-binding protein [Cycloclasticus]|jgi:nitrate/nitrite transport system ATP-binding protein|uniref:Nitrate ABC transporter ATP-binding protein n=1 Tax=Cycloclasticus zancles 78-ME TaxID=1198232 RepID=S5TG69_9GAMM|nr:MULTISPECIES: nitrate ABC transporter ATP-binding protein [Cycloclasticus]AFT67133.1 ATPase components of various ABC-type transport systems [Cycloclasticus sp. P1]AGS39827.1 Nitrate ABC transporter ATP-binding protein [Cycloclasticus zancles 78-ME]MBV1899808.1 nitrate ABC transporter ATP-binding protein [Cycloclasticus sp.]